MREEVIQMWILTEVSVTYYTTVLSLSLQLRHEFHSMNTLKFNSVLRQGWKTGLLKKTLESSHWSMSMVLLNPKSPEVQGFCSWQQPSPWLLQGYGYLDAWYLTAWFRAGRTWHFSEQIRWKLTKFTPFPEEF